MAGCHHDSSCDMDGAPDPGFRRALWIVLAINAVMFGVEMISGLFAHSVSLQADALDFLGDSANYILTLMVLSMSMRWRSSAALVKGATMGLFGLWVIGQALWNLYYGALPGAFVMGSVGFLALVANVASAGLLYTFRSGNANMRSVWLCSRNDAIGNVAVMLAAGGVFSLGSAWPDLLVALVMAGLALSSSVLIIRQATGELRSSVAVAE
ncbi:MAG: cation transporter [Alphaproteobacteria bacterium]|nr:cation transporter [Alphaproteobacteria bacterium]